MMDEAKNNNPKTLARLTASAEGSKEHIENVEKAVNPYIARWEGRLRGEAVSTAHRWTVQEVIDGAQAHYASLTLSRRFGQTGAEFDAENPEIREFGEWVKGLGVESVQEVEGENRVELESGAPSAGSKEHISQGLPSLDPVEEVFGNVIYSYSRSQAIEDGELVDVSKVAREAGIKFPVALTRAVWAKYVEVPRDDKMCQDEKGRLWDIVWMLRFAARRGGKEMLFKLHVAMPDRGDWDQNEGLPERGSGLRRATHRLVTLKAVCGPGDTPEPVITIMLPDED